jgi:hypothetical protein
MSEITIIGDSERRRVYDPKVIDRLVEQYEAEEAEKQRKALLGEKEASDEVIAPDNYVFDYLDESPLLGEDGKPFCATKPDLEAKFAQAGKMMATAADYYAAAKTGNQALFQALRDDFKEGIVCGDNVKISRRTHDALIYRKGSDKNVRALNNGIPLPDCSAGIEIFKFHKIADKKPDLIHKLFGTKDDIVEIAMTLETVTHITPFKTKILTPPAHFIKRSGKPLFYGVQLQYWNDQFHIFFYHLAIAKGRAHAVYFK